MSNKPGVVLTGGDFQGLAALRALFLKDIPVVIVDHDHCISRYSRCKHRFFHAPSPADTEAYCQFLIDLAARENLHEWVLIPNSDEVVYALSTHRSKLEECYRVATPVWDVIKNIYIKKNSYQLAKSIGIDIPVSFFPANIDELMELEIPFPAVIKPSIRDHLYQKERIKAYCVNNREELEKTYRHVCQLIDPSEIVVQDMIPGGANVLYSFCPFFKNGEVITSITAKRSRQHPMTFGHASTFAELVSIPELKQAAIKFLRATGYYGLCEVEFMFDKRDNTYKFLEINPRIWGWHSLAIAAGANLPHLLYSDMTGLPMETCSPVDTLKWVRLTTDIPTVIGELLNGRMCLKDYFNSMKGNKTYAVFSKHDPAPFFAELFLLPYLALKRGF